MRKAENDFEGALSHKATELEPIGLSPIVVSAWALVDPSAVRADVPTAGILLGSAEFFVLQVVSAADCVFHGPPEMDRTSAARLSSGPAPRAARRRRGRARRTSAALSSGTAAQRRRGSPQEY